MTEARIRMLDDLGAQFARVAAEHKPRSATPRRALVIALSSLVLLGGGAYAVPTTRAAIDDITSSLAGWVEGDEEQAPGRALRPDEDAPRWIRGEGSRVIAEAAGVSLFVSRTETDDGVWLKFALGEGIGIGALAETWRERFDDHAVVPLGPAVYGKGKFLDERGRFPLLGVTARSVDRVELRYTHGAPTTSGSGLDGGFVLIADAWRPLRELVAYDAAGRELDRVDVRDDMRYLCEKNSGCPPR